MNLVRVLYIHILTDDYTKIFTSRFFGIRYRFSSSATWHVDSFSSRLVEVFAFFCEACR